MKINPKNFYKRRLEYIPPYYQKIFCEDLNEAKIDILARWIYKNCNGKFGITKTTLYNNQIKIGYEVGFEEPTDLTFFILSGKAHKN